MTVHRAPGAPRPSRGRATRTAAGARAGIAPPPEPTNGHDRLCLIDRLQEVGGTLLTREEEILLSRLARDAAPEEPPGAGSSRGAAALAARNELVVRNLRLVLWLARKHLGRGLPLEDLVQEGTLGLIRAADKFDPESGNRFSTYATWWVRQAIGRAISDKGRTIRLPVHVREKLHKVLKCRDGLAASLGREPEDEEIARHLRTHRGGGSASSSWWTAERVTEVRRSAQDSLVDSLDRSLAGRHGPSGEESPLGSFVTDAPGDADPLEIACRGEALNSLGAALAKLPEREGRVLTRRYGLDGEEPSTLDEVGAELGMSRQGAQNLQARAEERLRRHLLLAHPTTPPAERGARLGEL